MCCQIALNVFSLRDSRSWCFAFLSLLGGISIDGYTASGLSVFAVDARRVVSSLGALTNSGAANIPVHDSCCIPVKYIVRNGIAELQGMQILNFSRKCQVSQVVVPIYIPYKFRN